MSGLFQCHHLFSGNRIETNLSLKKKLKEWIREILHQSMNVDIGQNFKTEYKLASSHLEKDE